MSSKCHCVCDWVSEMQTSPCVSWPHLRPYLARLASGHTLDQLLPYTKKGWEAGVSTRTWHRGQRGKLGVIFVFTSKWSFPTLKVSVTLADLSSCSMLVRVEWSRKTSGFCFAEFTKSSVSEKDFENQEIAHLNYSAKSVTVTALSLMSFGLWLWFSKALLNLLLFSFAHLLIG